MKKENNNWYFIHCDIYNVDIYMYGGSTKKYKENLLSCVKEHTPKCYNSIYKQIVDYVDNEKQNSYWCMDVDNEKIKNQTIVIYIENFNYNSIEDMGTFIHECTHAALYISILRGIVESIDGTCNEGFAYLVEWISKQFLSKFHQSKK